MSKLTTTKGKPYCISDDYIYITHKMNVNKTKQYWRCIKYRQNCRGRAISDFGSTELQVTRKHNHLADYEEVEVRHQKLQKKKERAVKRHFKVSDECSDEISEEAKKSSKPR